MPPTLSICIPTFNRAKLLESALASIAPQVTELGGEVELVVSDNCSTDNTREVVARIAEQYPVRYHRNDENIGVIRNVMRIVGDLARGEFCWILGDDEMVRAGGVRKILEAIKQHPDLDYFYVNYSIDHFERRDGVFVTADDFREWAQTGNANVEERRVERWETLIGEDFGGLTPVYCSVFRRSVWLEGAGSLRLNSSYTNGTLFSSVDETFPHSLILARTMAGKPAWSSGYPWVVMCSKESWTEFMPVVVLLRFHELLDAYVALSREERLVERHRRRMLSYGDEFLIRIVQGETLPQLQSFSVTKFIARHYRYAELWRALYRLSLATSVRQVARHSWLLAVGVLFTKAFVRFRHHWKRLWTHLGFSARGTAG